MIQHERVFNKARVEDKNSKIKSEHGKFNFISTVSSWKVPIEILHLQSIHTILTGIGFCPVPMFDFWLSNISAEVQVLHSSMFLCGYILSAKIDILEITSL